MNANPLKFHPSADLADTQRRLEQSIQEMSRRIIGAEAEWLERDMTKNFPMLANLVKTRQFTAAVRVANALGITTAKFVDAPYAMEIRCQGRTVARCELKFVGGN